MYMSDSVPPLNSLSILPAWISEEIYTIYESDTHKSDDFL